MAKKQNTKSEANRAKPKAQHSPTPWMKFQKLDDTETGIIVDKFNKPVAGGMDVVNAAFIVQAVNAHEALKKIVKELAEIPTVSETPGIAAHDDDFDALIMEARAALKLAVEV